MIPLTLLKRAPVDDLDDMVTAPSTVPMRRGEKTQIRGFWHGRDMKKKREIFTMRLRRVAREMSH